MNCVYAWYLRNTTPPTEAVIDNTMKGVLVGESFAELWPRMYVVQLMAATDHELFCAKCEKAREALPEGLAAAHLYYFVSPAVQPGRYRGWLQTPVWNELNRRAT
jgi:hypothetical protein